jgi:pyruvate-formate lyase-activating enzyme
MRVLLLNPPFDRPCIRDNYCSYSSNAGDLSSPVDLLVQTGLLGARHEVQALDAVAEGVSEQNCLEAFERFRPDAVLALTGTLSWMRDRRLFEQMARARPGLRLAITGDFLLSEGPRVLETLPEVSAVLTDYTVDSLVRWLEGEPGPLPGLHLRGVPALPNERGNGNVYTYPIPRHELFPASRYHLSIAAAHPFATVVTSIGCNFRCPFCIDSGIPIRYRALPNVIEELAWLQERGVREIYFYDPNLTARPARVRELARMLEERRLKLSFVCNAQVACLSGDLVEVLAGAGCHTVMLGLETGNDDALARNRKGFDTATARDVVRRCKAAGLKVLAYFLLGLPGESAEDARRTIDFATSLPLDYVSFNVFSPLPGTSLGTPFLERAEADGPAHDRSASPPASYCQIPAEELTSLRRQAYLRFYGRPSYLLGQLARVHAPGELARLVRSAWRLARNAWR